MYRLLTNIGITDYHNFRERRIIQILNVASILFAILLLLMSYFSFVGDEDVNGYLIIGTGFIFLLNLIWNRMGKILISKIVLCFYITIVPFLNIIITGQIPEGQYLSLMTIGLIFIVVSTILFDSKEEKFLYYFSIVFYLAWIMFSDKLIYSLSVNKPNIEYLLSNYTFYKNPPIAGLIAIVGVISIFKNIIHNYEVENEFVKAQLLIKNQELELYNQRLEENVKARTVKLTEANQKIMNLAFMTSHKIRGPLTSIMGITGLLKNHPEDEETRAVLPELYDKSLEMDIVIRRMANVLEETRRQGVE